MSKVIWFEIPADNPARAIKFYENVFGWKVEKWDGPYDYWFINNGKEDEPGIQGAIMTKERGKKVRDIISIDFPYMEVEKKIAKAGGKMLTDVMQVPGGFTGSFEDTEGNEFIIIADKKD
jgi:predicted enzyme related to lactoylglutathione lyase